MASLLYRLGRFSARRAGLVVVAWVVLLGLAGLAYAVGHGTLTESVTIPNTKTSQVTDTLAKQFPKAAGGSGTIVFHTADGQAFTDAEKQGVADALKKAEGVDGVKSTTDPFTTQQQLDAQEQQLADGRAQIAQARQQLAAGDQQLSAAQRQLDAAKQQAVEAGAGIPDRLAAQQQQLDAQKQQLASSEATLDARSEQLAHGATLARLSSGLRFVSTDGSAALANVTFDEDQYSVTSETKDAVIHAVSHATPDGVRVDFSQELTQSIPEVFGPGEAVGLVVAAVALLVMLGTLIAAGLPILSALLGVAVSIAGSLALSGAIEMLSVTPVLGVMLGLAVGIDYSLFILNRHRTQLRDGVRLEESIALANGTSGNAVVFAGVTVLIALLALNITGIPFLGLMGTVGAISVATAILVAVTFTPAMLKLVGMRMLSKRVRSRVGHTAPVAVPQSPQGRLRSALTLVVGVTALIVIALPALSMRLGLPDGSTEPVDSTQYRAFQVTERQFGAGVNGPLVVLADTGHRISSDDVTAEEARIGSAIAGQGDVAAVAPIGLSRDREQIAFQVLPEHGPTSVSTEDLVNGLRDASPVADGVDLGVAGAASGAIDISARLASVLPVYLAIVIGLSLLILIVVFRSILVPVTATLGFVLSLFATFGALTAIFQFGWLGFVFGVHDPGPILNFLPIIVVGVLFGLAMDYQLFLVSGMREAFAHGAPARIAVRRGLHAGRRVVTAAAIIMTSVFSGFVFSNSALIRPIGFGLAFGVLVDAFVVRMLLIPAVMTLAGRSAWWIPRWLDRVLPDVDVEGASLEREHPVVDAARDAGRGSGAPAATGAGVTASPEPAHRADAPVDAEPDATAHPEPAHRA